MSRMNKLVLAAGLLSTLPVLFSSPAVACGGFFCSQMQPVDQAAERILFVKDGEEMVAHVQIQYTGPSEKFSWVVPVPTPPKLSVGSDLLFQTLRNSTRPQFNLNLRTEGVCRSDARFDRGSVNYSAVVPTSAGGAVAQNSVQVISRETVGPYDTVVLKGDSPEELKKWLRDNGYDIPEKTDALLTPYIQNKMYLLALKLLKNRDAGDLQPIVMRFVAAKPMIPIQLTAVAATPDMDIQLWILGAHRAIPVNYPHVEINEARLNWMQAGSNYRQVVTEAMNEAGGRGFVTDYAGDSKVVPLAQLDPNRYNLESLRSLRDPVAFANAVRGFFPSNGAYVSFISRHIPKPAAHKDVEDSDFYSQLPRYREALAQAESTVDTGAAISELQTTLVNPLKDIRRLFMENPYLTGMFTTLSPEEMTLDPMFDFNPQLPKVALLRQAEGVRLCSRDVYSWEAPVRITTPKGLTFMALQNASSLRGLAALPAAARIQRTAATGSPETLTDNTAKITSTLASNQAVTIQPDGTAAVRPFNQGFGCACAGPNTVQTTDAELENASEGLAYFAFILAYVGWRRWRKKQP